MKTPKQKSNLALKFVLACCLFVSLCVVADSYAQFVNPVTEVLSRGKMWQTSYGFGLEGTNSFSSYASYPGIAKGRNKNNFINDRTWFYYMGCKDDYCLMQRQRRFGIDRTFLIPEAFAHTLVKNYNFENSATMPEEYKTGGWVSPPAVSQDGGLANLLLEGKVFKAVWSLPDYDDFLISRNVIKNVDTVPLTDVRLGWYLNMTPSRGGYDSGGGARRFRDDNEYLWLDDTEIALDLDAGEGAFVFFDDTEIRQATGAVTPYDIEPGATYGDRGDPGNIKILGSIDSQLYSPQVISYAIIDCTPLKDGTKRATYNIISAENDQVDWSFKGGGIPGPEFFRYDTGTDFGTYDEHMGYVGAQGNAQIRRDWKDLNANPDPSKPTDGSFFERVPTFFITAGPWDLAPGDSAEVWTLLIGGDADRNITMKGGLDAVALLPDASVENLKENWANAMQLYRAAKANGFTDWNAGITAYPPPSPGNVPEMGLGDELVIDTFSEVVGGTPSQGYLVRWPLVPDSYTDPLSGVNDLKEYVVRKSVIGIEGPWEESARIAKSAVVTEDGLGLYKVEAAPNIPTRWSVTAVDNDGNESAQIYSFFAVSAAPPPIDDDMSQITVVPNPYRQISGLLDPGEFKNLTFVNIPAQCTIRIYTVAGDLVKTIRHEGFGATSWGSSPGNNYLLTDFGSNVAPGVYIYHVENEVDGFRGKTQIGKFAILK